MSMTAEQLRAYRAKRKAEGGCYQCAADAVPGETACARHKELARVRRARYEQRQREATGRTWSAHLERHEHERERRIAVLREWAAEHGYVPSHSETAAIVGTKHNRRGAGEEMRNLRRYAFGVRTLGVDEVPWNARIPYPVPAEFLADTAA